MAGKFGYKYYQPNKKDLKDKCSDCSIRALTKFEGITWVEAYDLLSVKARESQTMPNDINNIKAVMEDMKIPFTSCKKDKWTVREFAKKNKGRSIAYVRAGFGTHLVAIEDGCYFDTWDSGDKLLYGFWK